MTKQKNETTTELKTTVADKISTAGQRAVHFRTLAILGIAAACGLSVPPPAPLVLAACTALCTPLYPGYNKLCIVQLLPVSLALVSVAILRIHPPCLASSLRSTPFSS